MFLLLDMNDLKTKRTMMTVAFSNKKEVELRHSWYETAATDAKSQYPLFKLIVD